MTKTKDIIFTIGKGHQQIKAKGQYFSTHKGKTIVQTSTGNLYRIYKNGSGQLIKG